MLFALSTSYFLRFLLLFIFLKFKTIFIFYFWSITVTLSTEGCFDNLLALGGCGAFLSIYIYVLFFSQVIILAPMHTSTFFTYGAPFVWC